MKKYLLFLLALFSINTFAQNTGKNLQTARKIQNEKPKTFFEIQKEFYDYWAPYKVTKGFYYENGERVKAPGWKQFKRWEWYWENRVNPQTGAFPDTTQDAVFNASAKCITYGITATSGSWTSLGPLTTTGGYEGLGRINCIAFHPSDNNTYWAGSPSGGLWSTTDNGSTWNPLTDDNSVIGVSDIAIAPDYTTSHTIYIGTGDRDGGSLHTLGGGQHNDNNGIGVLKSTNGGTTWSATGLAFHAFEYVTVNRVLVNPDRYNTVLAATSYGIFISYDGGDNWGNAYWDNFIDLEYKPGDTSVLYACTETYWGQPIIVKSTNGGGIWSTVKTFTSNERRVDLAVTANDPSYVYAVVCKNDNSLEGVYRSTDSGSSFTKVYDGTTANHNLLGWKTDGSDAGGQGSYDLSLAVSPSDKNKVFLGGVNVHKSIDGGTTWTAVTCWTSSATYNKNSAPVVHADHHTLHFRSSDGILFNGNDGGIYSTSDDGSSWSDKTNGIIPSQMYRLSNSKTSSTEIITGLQDNGTKLYNTGTWSDVMGGDGTECIIDYSDINIQYAATPEGNIERTTDHWSNSTRITQDYLGNPINGLTETGSWVTPYAIDPANHETLYIGLENVWKTTNKGDSWTKISSMNFSDKLRSLAVAPSDNQTIYVAGKDSIWKTTNDGTNWSNITGSLPTSAANITYISVNNSDASKLWVSMGEYDNNGVYASSDGGTTWTNISTGLPAVPVMCVIENKQNTAQTELYAATDVGVYAKVGEGNWFEFSSGLPNVVVTELEAYYDDTNHSNSRLRAASYGRGLWESGLYSAPSSAPVADFSADDITPEINTTVSFTDQSSNVPQSWLWNFSPNSVTYVDGTSSTSVNPKVQFTDIGTYTVTLTATNAVGNGTETKQNYINVGYCDADGYAGSASYITDVELNYINNTGTGSDGYKNYTTISTALHLGYIYFITVHNGNTGNQDDDLGVWVDWNEDGDFNDANEQMVCVINNYGKIENGNFQVPSGTSYGTKRMRIRIKTAGSNCGGSCGDAWEGEVEDYTISVERETNTWQGTNSNDWSDSQNWSLGIVPTNDYDVSVPTAPSGGVFPEIKAGVTANCHKLTLQQGATITINGTLHVEISN